MQVNKRDGTCRSCGGILEITDADEATMEVTCTECADSYQVETDAFSDGCMTYWVKMMTRRREEGGEDK